MITKETNENEPVVGIIGGMGPEATVDLMARIIRATPAADDADHIRMLVDNNPKIPSRLKAIVERSGPSPVPVLIDMARQLAAWGADLLVIPCNTAHFYRDAIAAAVKVPVLDMIALAADRTTAMVPAGAPVGLLAADGALQTGLYQRAFGARDRRLLIPAPSEQARLMAVIRAIKTGRHGEREQNEAAAVARSLGTRGAVILLVACTELSVIAASFCYPPTTVVDAAQVLAEAVVVSVKGECVRDIAY